VEAVDAFNDLAVLTATAELSVAPLTLAESLPEKPSAFVVRNIRI